jgi:hypothetical protein
MKGVTLKASNFVVTLKLLLSIVWHLAEGEVVVRQP